LAYRLYHDEKKDVDQLSEVPPASGYPAGPPKRKGRVLPIVLIVVGTLIFAFFVLLVIFGHSYVYSPGYTRVVADCGGIFDPKTVGNQVNQGNFPCSDRRRNLFLVSLVLGCVGITFVAFGVRLRHSRRR
jgi:hypothetical protein